MVVDAEHAGAPALPLLWGEWRAATEFGALLMAAPWLSLLPKGEGQPVLVLPGLAANDMTTRPLRLFLRSRGYRTYGWGMGQNRGFRDGVREGLLARLDEVSRANGGQSVSLVGWSLGGIYARELAKIMPEQVRQVITLGTPFRGNPRASNAWRLYEYLSGHSVDEIWPSITSEFPSNIPFASIYSRTDGVVNWQCAIETKGEQRENIEIRSSHCGIAHHPVALYVIADRLALREGEWAPFEGRGCGYLFPKAEYAGASAA